MLAARVCFYLGPYSFIECNRVVVFYRDKPTGDEIVFIDCIPFTLSSQLLVCISSYPCGKSDHTSPSDPVAVDVSWGVHPSPRIPCRLWTSESGILGIRHGWSNTTGSPISSV